MTQPTAITATATFRWTGRIGDLDGGTRRLIFDRSSTSDTTLEEKTRRLLQSVREDGDAALFRFAREYDRVDLQSLQVDMDRCHEALRSLDPALRQALERARANIASAAVAFRPLPTEVETESGVRVGRRPDALERAGIYAPGGRASYPSSLLMGAVTARVAGVQSVIVCSPPAPNGVPEGVLLAAAALAEVDAVYAVGGAGAIAAMTFGTETVPAVDIIAGPGNAYVAEAKRQVAAFVATDAPAGPSELLIIADAHARADVIAREVLAQAEHDPQAAVVVLCVGERVAQALTTAVARLLPDQQRAWIIRESLANNGAVLTARDYDEAIAFARAYAPEHLLLVVDPALESSLLASVRNAGTVFLGETSSVAFGDYMTGANHVLPTNGGARLRSGLSVLDFVRWTTWQRVDPPAATRLASDVAIFAESEGLPAHASAARQWERP